jgi:hypothetical protein
MTVQNVVRLAMVSGLLALPLTGSTQTAQQILAARMFKVGAQFNF